MRYDPSRLILQNEDDYQEAVGWLITEVGAFTENWIKEHDSPPDLDDFIECRPIFDHEIFYPQITKEMGRITDLVQKEIEP